MKLLITGATGFLGKHVVLAALNAGHDVTGTLRNPARADEVRAAITPHLTDPASLSRLRFTPLDLTRDDGWDTALAGQDALIHTASPFPISEPRSADDLIVPARDGTRRALIAAAEAGVSRVVLTSSCVAIWEQVPSGQTATEADWSDPDAPGAAAYGRSKTIAERLAWDLAEQHSLALTTINPSVILGPPLDSQYGSSTGIVKRLMTGKDPMNIDVAWGCVDVRDVAAMHVIAAERPDTAGERFIADSGTRTFSEWAAILKTAYPDRKIPQRVAPAWMVAILALFDKDIRSVKPLLGRRYRASNAKATERMGIRFKSPDEALLSCAAWLVTHNEV